MKPSPSKSAFLSGHKAGEKVLYNLSHVNLSPNQRSRARFNAQTQATSMNGESRETGDEKYLVTSETAPDLITFGEHTQSIQTLGRVDSKSYLNQQIRL